MNNAIGSIRCLILGLPLVLMLTVHYARAQSSICYAAPDGSDVNDGSYWALAKADVMACYEALPPAGGTIFVREGGNNRRGVRACNSTEPPGCGIWIMGPRDPNYSRPPAGWRQAKNGSVSIIGIGGYGSSSFTLGGQVGIFAGSHTSTASPAIWLSDVQSGMTFKNLAFAYPCEGQKIGIDSNGNRVNVSTASWNLKWDNVSIQLNQTVGCGPGTDIESASNNLFFNNVQLTGNNAEINELSSLVRSSGTVTARSATALPSSWATGTVLGILGTLAFASTPAFGGSGYAVGDTGTINGGKMLATYAVASISGNGPTGPVLAYAMTTGGNGYQIASFVTTTRGGVRPGHGRGLEVNIIQDHGFPISNASIRIINTTTFTYAQAGPNDMVTGGFASSDQSQPMTSNAGRVSGQGPGLLHIKDSLFGGGGLKIYSSGEGFSGTFESILQESGFSPMVWLATCQGNTYITAKDLIVSDLYAHTPLPGLRDECSSQYASKILAINTVTDGTATIVASQPSDPTRDPLLNNQSGIYYGRLIGQTDAARRGFGPVATPWGLTNLAKSESSWIGSVVTQTTGQTAPDGTKNAVTVSATTSGNQRLFFYDDRHTINVGDILVCGVWTSALNPPGYSGNYTTPLSLNIAGSSYTTAWVKTGTAGYEANGEWEWVWQAQKMSSIGSSPTLQCFVNLDPTKALKVYAPTLLYIPSGTMSDNEAIELAENLQAFRNDALAGQVSLLAGEQFKADSIQLGNGPIITSGLGPPKGAATAGSIYLRRDGTPGSTFYIYEKDGWKSQF